MPKTYRLFVLPFLFYSFSGFCFLALETLWIRTVGLFWGNTVASATLVICVFFLCAAFGNAFYTQKIAQKTSPKIYGILEVLCGTTALGLFLLKDIFIFPHPLLFVFALIGLPSFIAGASFPALSRLLIQHPMQRTTHAGRPYAGNLLGAAFGIVMGGLYLPSRIGYTSTFYLCSAAMVFFGILAAFTLRPLSAVSLPTAKAKKRTDDLSSYLSIALIVGSGFISIGLEVLILIYFRQMMPLSLQATLSVLCGFLVGMGIGSLIATGLRNHGFSTLKLLRTSLWMSFALTLLYSFIFVSLQKSDFLFQTQALGISTLGMIGLSTVILLPLLIFVGMIFPLTWEVIQNSTSLHAEVIARCGFYNKLGCAVGAFVAPYVLVKAFGVPEAFMILGWGYGIFALFISSKKWLVPAIGFAGVLFAFRNDSVQLSLGDYRLQQYAGPDGIVAVYEDEKKSRHILVNQSYVLNGTQRALLSQKHESWVPLLLNKNPQHVAFIGMASGISANAALDFPISKLDAIELIPEVMRAAKDHFSEWNQRLFTDSRAHLIQHDGRHAIQASQEPYDVVIADLLLPSQDGTASLYSKDFFEIVSKKLSSSGLFCLWLPLFQMDDEIAGIVLRTFREAFPYALAIRGNLDPVETNFALIGSKVPLDLSSEFLESRLQANPALALQSPFFKSAANFKVLLAGDLQGAKADALSTSVNTDDHPIIAFVGPKRIEPGRNLRGITYLNWSDRVFRDSPWPQDLQNAVTAGNHYFAAKVYDIPIPGMGTEMQMNRQLLSTRSLQMAKTLSPRADLGSSY